VDWALSFWVDLATALCPERRKKFANPRIATSSYLRESATAEKISGSLFAVDRRLGAFFKRLQVPNHAFASVVSELEILGQFESIGRTGIFAEAAKHAAAEIISEFDKFFAAGLLIALAGDNNEIFWTRQGAKVAGYAECFVAIGIDIKSRRSAISLGDLGPF